MTTPEGFFRSATESDIDSIVRIENEAFDRPWNRASLLDELTWKDAFSCIWEQEDGVAAYLLLRRIVDEIHVMRIAVDRRHRRRGLAERLMGRCIDIAKQCDARSILLEVRPSNIEAIGLYRKLGFTLLGKRKNYYPENGEDALMMGYKTKEES